MTRKSKIPDPKVLIAKFRRESEMFALQIAKESDPKVILAKLKREDKKFREMIDKNDQLYVKCLGQNEKTSRRRITSRADS